MTATYEDFRKTLDDLVVQTCRLRAQLYLSLRPQKSDSPQEQEQKARDLLAMLVAWSKDPVQWIKDLAWAPDPKGRFGGRAVPSDLVRAKIIPRGAVPIILWPKQEALVRRFFETLDDPEEKTLAVLASRQVIKTTLAIWCSKHCFDFRAAFSVGLTTYDEKLIDVGGKGQRSHDSLFGRFRLFNDYVVTCLPNLKYNQHQAPHPNSKPWKRRQWEDNLCGLTESQDMHRKITRGKLIVHGVEMFPEAEGNFAIGDQPGDGLFRGQSLTLVIPDELGQIAGMKGGEMDRKSMAACDATCKMRFPLGTLPEGGGHGTLMNELMFDTPENPAFAKMFLNWTEVAPYRIGGWWKCDWCGKRHEDGNIEIDAPAGIVCECVSCKRETVLHLRDCNLGVEKFGSPWWTRRMLAMPDRNALAREYLMDPGGAQGSRFFHTWERGRVRWSDVSPGSRYVEGFDPGKSAQNCGAWILAEFDVRRNVPVIRGYWMAPEKHALWWLPFLKRWDRQRLQSEARSIRLPWGPYAGRSVAEVFDYPEDALRMLDRCAPLPRNDVWGDKWGSHDNMAGSVYDVFYSYGVFVQYEYTKDREELCRKGIDWAARAEIDPWLERIRPNGKHPSIVDVFDTARPKPMSGQSEPKLDVDKQNPPFVHNAVDAWLYACKGFPDDVHGVVDAGGSWGTAADIVSEPFVYGGCRP